MYWPISGRVESIILKTKISSMTRLMIYLDLKLISLMPVDSMIRNKMILGSGKNSLGSYFTRTIGIEWLYSVLDPDFLRKLEQGCYSHVAAVWDRYEFEHCRKLTSWKRRTGFLVSLLPRIPKIFNFEKNNLNSKNLKSSKKNFKIFDIRKKWKNFETKF